MTLRTATMPKARVLVIEDEEPIRRFLSAAWVDAGYDVARTASRLPLTPLPIS